MRSLGARELQRRGKTQEAIAEKVGVSRVAVSHWLAGTTKPGPAKRAALAAAYGIPPEAWDQKIPPKAKAAAAALPSAPIAPVEIPEGVLGKAKMLEQMAHDLMVRLQEEMRADKPDSTHLEVAKVMNSVATTLNLLAKLTGQYELGSRLFRLPVWKRIEAAIYAGLSAHPKAAAELAKHLRTLEAEETA